MRHTDDEDTATARSQSRSPSVSAASGSAERKAARATTVLSIVPKLSSSESLNNSPGPSSPGISNNADSMHAKGSELTRKESYKAQRKCYRQEKKRVANELMSSLNDPSVVVLADWLKVRGSLKSWTKLWCILKPGLLLLYKSQKIKSSAWVGTVLLSTCQVIERPSKKDGFCFKLFQPLDQSIWAPKGPERESIGAVIQPLPTSHLIFRAPSQAAGKCWMDALELSMRCSSNLLVRSLSNKSSAASANHETQWSEADCENRLEHGSQPGTSQLCTADGDGDVSESESDSVHDDDDEEAQETPYVPNEEDEEFGGAGEQTEELAEENKCLIWLIIKQLRPGMDLSKVVLPTFILEPRSFLEKMADSYYHVDLLSKAVQQDDAFTRMKLVVKWYLSGLYKKPKGLKKPYNPILGETFRCYWQHPSGSRTFYIAEQVSHHPPVSALFVTNRQDGFSISTAILAKSKFYGNSTSAILDGVAVLSFLPRGEAYTMTVPYAHCRGIVVGTLTMELGGKVTINCEKTGYSADIEFKLKSFLGGSDQVNHVIGKLKMGKETLATIEGHWDGMITYKDVRNEDNEILWNPTPAVRKTRLRRYTVPLDHQGEWESERLWHKVSLALAKDDQNLATTEKSFLEEAQRAAAKNRKSSNAEWYPKYFERDLNTGQWVYKHADLRPWDSRNDVYQFESEYKVQTKTKHRTPIIRTSSITSVDNQQQPILQTESRTSLSALKSSKKRLTSKRDSNNFSGTTSEEFHSDSSRSANRYAGSPTSKVDRLAECIGRIDKHMADQTDRMDRLQEDIRLLVKHNYDRGRSSYRLYVTSLLFLLVVSIVQFLISYKGRA